ncbi:MAG: carbohydrate ABC transporter permease [Thermomicrobiales bacterium]
MVVPGQTLGDEQAMVASEEAELRRPQRGHRSQRDQNPLWADLIIYAILLFVTLLTLLPMLNVLAKSLSDAASVSAHPTMLIPKHFNLDAYRYIFRTPVLIRSFGITVFVTVVGTFLNMVVTTMAAYGLSKTEIPGHRFLMWLVIVPMLFSAGLLPTYILMKDLGLLNSIWVLIIPGLVSPFNLILLRNFFWSIPPELEDAARLDGASDLRTLWDVVLPLSKPVIATVSLFYAVGHWNDFFTGLFFISDNSKWPLQVVLRSIIVDQSMMNMGGASAPNSDVSQMVVSTANITSATIIFAIVPILLVYPFLQRHFVKGIMLGSVKG